VAAEKDAVAGAEDGGRHGGEARVLAARSGVELGFGRRMFEPIGSDPCTRPIPIQLLVGLAEQAKQVNGVTLISKVTGNSNSHLKPIFQASEAMPSIKTHTQDEVK
jgi:hypothetical protein